MFRDGVARIPKHRKTLGENIRKYAYDRASGSFRFEWTGTYWRQNRLLTATGLWPPPLSWITLTTVAATNQDWILGYTNTTAWADGARFYTATVSTNSTGP